MAYYITTDGFRPDELSGDYYLGNPNSSPLRTPYSSSSPIHLSNKLFNLFCELDHHPVLSQTLRKIDSEFYSPARVTFYEPHCVYDKVYAERNEYNDFVSLGSLTEYNGAKAFRNGDKGYLVLDSYETEELEDYEKDMERAFEKWKEEKLMDGEEEEDLYEDEFFDEYDRDFFGSTFNAGSVWVDYKEGTWFRLADELKRFRQDLGQLPGGKELLLKVLGSNMI